MTSLYAILDIVENQSIVHHVVSLNISDPDNISYVPFGTISGFEDKYFFSAILDPVQSKIFFGLSDSTSNTSVENIYLYSITFPDLATVTPFCTINTVYVNLNPQATYNIADNLFYYAINNDPNGFDYTINTIDSDGNIVVTSINVSNIQNSNYGIPIFNDYIYATLRPGNSFTVYYASLNDNTSGSITSPITPQPPGNIWSVFDLSGVLWGSSQMDASDPPGLSLYQLQCTQNGLPGSDSFPVAFIGDMPTTYENNSITNITLFTPSACIHGSSKVHLADMTKKQISTLTTSDIVRCPDNKQAKIKQIIPCWNHLPNQPSQQMIVFEKDSLSHNTPDERFAIDPQHPICTIDDYLKYGIYALRPARMFANNRTIYRDTIDNIHLGIMEPNIRYDLVLEGSNVYIANNVVVKARKSFRDRGY